MMKKLIKSILPDIIIKRLYSIYSRLKYLGYPWNKKLKKYSHGGQQLKKMGYEIIQGFLDRENCLDLIKQIDSYLKSKSYMINDVAYLNVRSDNTNNKIDNFDKNVRAIVHFQNLNKWAKELFISGEIERIFEDKYGEKFVLESITAQIDEPTLLKRGYHVDGYTPQFKAFIYLNDVINYNDQPFTIVPDSHKWRIRQTFNIFYNILRDQKNTDMNILIPDNKSFSFFGEAGTMILSNQLLAHKGWPQKSGKRRYMLVLYLTPHKFYNNRILNIGRNNKYLNPKVDLNKIRYDFGLKGYDDTIK